CKCGNTFQLTGTNFSKVQKRAVWCKFPECQHEAARCIGISNMLVKASELGGPWKGRTSCGQWTAIRAEKGYLVNSF
ncbi:MAG: hypothetical protein ACKESB_03835, partial [Candidatus Hodgkinia cicadicola]